jgi:polysaccharide biosynthesis transport protein
LISESHLKNNLERQRTLFNSVVDQLRQAQLVSDFGSITAQTINPPGVSEVRQQRGFFLAAALLAGVGLGAGIAFVADQLDSRIRSLSEMRRALNLSVLGLIPSLSREQRETSGVIGLICHSLPRSFISEAYKSVRTNFEYLRRSRNAQVILVTSPQSGDGKSTTASNLAISLAHAGRKVLLIDADMRRPTQHQIYGFERDRGLPHVLKDILPLHRAVRPSQVENLDLLLAGPEVSNPAELLASNHLARCVEEVRQAYDVVIIDSPPLLAVADPSIIAASADGVILVVRTTSTCRPDVERTVELLKTLGTPVLGAVINGITPEQMGVRYGSQYRYGYGYGYGSYGSNGPRSGDELGEGLTRPEIVSEAGPR